MHVTFPRDLEMLKSVCRGTTGTEHALLEQWRGSETRWTLGCISLTNKVVISLLFGILLVVRVR